MVAVEAQHRRELPDHLQHLGGDDQQDGVPAGQPPHAEGQQHDQGVEVEAAEVGAHPAGPAEPVAVGDVGVEGRPEQVDAEAHRAGCGPAVAGRGGVAELVEAGRQHGDDDDGEEERGVGEGLRGGGRQPLVEQHPPGDRAERQHHGDDDQRAEQDGEGRGQAPRDRRIGDHLLEPEREQRDGPADLGLARRRPRRSRPSGRSEVSTSCRTSSGLRPAGP